jgi:hypothetical protein
MSKKTNPLDSRRPLTEEQIRTHTIGELKPLSGQILVVDYDPLWPELFGREADRIRVALGHRVLRIEHTGSTSVPGLVAKPTKLRDHRAIKDTWKKETLCCGMFGQAKASLLVRTPS